MIEYIALIITGVIVATLVMMGLSKTFRPLIIFYNLAGVTSGSAFLLTDNNIATFMFHLWATMIPLFILMFIIGLFSS